MYKTHAFSQTEVSAFLLKLFPLNLLCNGNLIEINVTRTNLFLETSVIPSILQQSMSPLMMNQQAIVQNKIEPKTDNTATVYLENPPQSTEEDKDAAAYLGNITPWLLELTKTQV